MFRFDKTSCFIYVCISIIIGGISAYFTVKHMEENYDYVKENKTYSSNSRNIELYKNTEKIAVSSQKKQEQILDGLKIPIPVQAELTAYCNCTICSEAWGSQTSMQTHTRIGVAAAPKDIPLGSKLFIPILKNYKEDRIYVVEDRGGAVVVKKDGTHIIDIWLPTHEEVKDFGRIKTMIYLMQ